MLVRLAAIALSLTLCAQSAQAEGRHFLGYGWLAVNDLIGDGKDRWRTGSFASSRVFGYGWDGAAPEKFGDLIEVRLGGEVISPRNLSTSGPGDRPFAGAIAWGLHTHFDRKATQFSMGADLVAIGPMTGLDSFQTWLHDLIDIPSASDSVLDAQISDQWRARGVIEVGHELDLSDKSRLRPFVEARAGDENLLRAGFDYTLGSYGQSELLVRDWVTGQRYHTVGGRQPGVSLVLGADVAKVYDSVYLPENRGFELTDARGRVRAGLHWRNEKTHLFYGLTWLSEEFVGQEESQLVGAIRMDFKF